MQETLKANPYVYAANDPVNATDPSGENSVLGCVTTVIDTLAFSVFDALSAIGIINVFMDWGIAGAGAFFLSFSAAFWISLGLAALAFIGVLAYIIYTVAYCLNAA